MVPVADEIEEVFTNNFIRRLIKEKICDKIFSFSTNNYNLQMKNSEIRIHLTVIASFFS